MLPYWMNDIISQFIYDFSTTLLLIGDISNVDCKSEQDPGPLPPLSSTNCNAQITLYSIE